MANGKGKVQIGFREASAGGNAQVEIAVAAGTTRADLKGILAKVLPSIEKLRPRGCLSCLSGLDIHIREQYEQILTLDA